MSVVLQLRPTPDGPQTPALEALNPQQRAFVLHFLLGKEDVRGKVVKSYVAAGYRGSNENSIASAASQLRNHPGVKLAIEEGRAELEKEFKARMISWVGMGVKAQMVLERAVDSMLLDPKDSNTPRTYLSANQISVLREVLDRALGRPTQPHTHDVGEKLDGLITRLAAERKGKGLISPAPVDMCVGDVPAPVEEIVSGNLGPDTQIRFIVDDSPGRDDD